MFIEDTCYEDECIMFGGRKCPVIDGDMSSVYTAECPLVHTSDVYHVAVWITPQAKETLYVTEIEMV